MLLFTNNLRLTVADNDGYESIYRVVFFVVDLFFNYSIILFDSLVYCI